MFIIMRSSVFAGTGSGFWWRKGTAGKGGGRMGRGHVGLAGLGFLVDQVRIEGIRIERKSWRGEGVCESRVAVAVHMTYRYVYSEENAILLCNACAWTQITAPPCLLYTFPLHTLPTDRPITPRLLPRPTPISTPMPLRRHRPLPHRIKPCPELFARLQITRLRV
jgi:hypothetical protein